MIARSPGYVCIKFLFILFYLIFFIHDTSSAKNIYIRKNDKDECISNHTVLAGAHV